MSKNHILIAQRKMNDMIVGKGTFSDPFISMGKYVCEMEVFISERLLRVFADFPQRDSKVWLLLRP